MLPAMLVTKGVDKTKVTPPPIIMKAKEVARITPRMAKTMVDGEIARVATIKV